MAAPVYQKDFIQDIKQEVRVRNCGGLMFTGDALADTIKVSVYNGSNAYALSGTVVCNCIRADGATVPVSGSISGNTAQATLTQACCAVQGPLAVVMKVTSGGVTSTILKAVYTVDVGETGTVVDPGTIIPDVAALIAEIEEALGTIPPEYSDLVAMANGNVQDMYINGDALQTGRVYQTLRPTNFGTLYANNTIMEVISGDVAHAQQTANSSWKVYRYDFGQRMVFRLEDIARHSGITGVLPAAAMITVDGTTTYFSLDTDREGGWFTADALLLNVSNTLGAAVDTISITASVCRDFEDLIVCADHASEFDNIVVFGDSIFANYISSSATGNGVIAQFVAMMGLPVVNNAVGGATLSTIQESPKNVVTQVANYISATGTPSGTPLYLIDGGTNDQYNDGHGLNNLGAYTDGVNGITSSIYGATYAIINALLGFGAQPWQIVICTPIPKGIRGDAAYVAAMDAQLTAIGAAMYEVGAVQMVNVINGYHGPFDNLDSATAKTALMTDDTHPSVYGATLYAERIFKLLYSANVRDYADLKSVIDYTLRESSGTYVVPDDEIIQSSTSNRIKVRAFLPVAKGQVLTFEHGSTTAQIRIYYYNLDGTSTGTDSGWLGGNQRITFDASYYLLILYRTGSNDGAISPSDYDATTTVYMPWKIETDANAGEIAGLKSAFYYDVFESGGVYTVPEGAIEQGSSSNRIRVKGIIPVSKGQKLAFDYGSTTKQINIYRYAPGTDTVLGSSGWLGGSQTITFNDNYDLLLLFRTGSNDGAISPSDYDATVKIYAAWKVEKDALAADVHSAIGFMSNSGYGVTDVLLEYNSRHSYTGTNNITIDTSNVSNGSEIYAYIDCSNFNIVDGSTVKFYLRQMNAGNTTNLKTCEFSPLNSDNTKQLVAHIPYNSSAGMVTIIYILGANSLLVDAMCISVGGYRIVEQNDTVYYVSTDGSDANIGTQASPYATIGKALRMGGKMIYVKPGTYAEKVVMNGLDGVTIAPYGFSAFSTSTPDTPMIVLDGGENLTITNGLYITDCTNIRIENVHCKNTSSYPILVDNCNGLTMKYCKASDSLNAGFKISDTFGAFESCEAYDLGDEDSQYCDGFGISGYGDTTFINCSGHDNQDDGISHHDGCTGTVIGGEWYNNGKGGVCTPTHGARVNVSGAYCHHNAYGIFILAENPGRTTRAMVSGCVMKNNSTKDFDVRGGSEVVAWNNIYDTKYVSESSTLTEFWV